MLSLVAFLLALLETLNRICLQFSILSIDFNLERITKAWYFSISLSGVLGRHFPKTNPLSFEWLMEIEDLTEDEAAAIVDESTNPQTVIILTHGVAFNLKCSNVKLI